MSANARRYRVEIFGAYLIMEYNPQESMGPVAMTNLFQDQDELSPTSLYQLPGKLVEVRAQFAVNKGVNWHDICKRTGAKLLLPPKEPAKPVDPVPSDMVQTGF